MSKKTDFIKWVNRMPDITRRLALAFLIGAIKALYMADKRISAEKRITSLDLKLVNLMGM